MLQAEDHQARYFHFRKQRSELSWQQVHAVELEEVIQNVDTEMLGKVRQGWRRDRRGGWPRWDRLASLTFLA
jgi:hypothetical protein